jgi:hypothetical protein
MLFTVVVPMLNVLPDAGLDVTVAIPQASVEVTVKFTAAVQRLGSVF